MRRMKLDIVLWPHPILLAGTDPVTEVDEELRAVVGEMRRLLFELRGVGLAAPQVGVVKRLMLVCPSGEPGDDTVMLNPEIVESEGAVTGEEGCLSFPGIYGRVSRASSVVVRDRDLALRWQEAPLPGFVARIFQHELDHLNGDVFVDRMLRDDRAKVESALGELREHYAASVA